MNKNYDLAVGAKRLEKVTPSLIRTILDRASVLRSEGKPVIRSVQVSRTSTLRPISRKQRSARSQTIRVNILPTADIRL